MMMVFLLLFGKSLKNMISIRWKIKLEKRSLHEIFCCILTYEGRGEK